MKMIAFIVALLLAGSAAAQITVPGSPAPAPVPAPAPAAGAEANSDAFRRLIAGKWKMELEMVDEQKFRHYISFDWTMQTDGTSTRRYYQSITGPDGKEAKGDSGDEPMYFRVDPIDAQTFKFTEWAQKGPTTPTERILSVTDNNTLQELDAKTMQPNEYLVMRRQP